ncbi:MAG TPA: hypothetical protein VIU34_16475 [Steroidobacter sp.]
MSTRQTSTPGSGPERRIALIKPSANEEQAGHAVQLFDSVLWVFKGTTRSSWVTTPAATADIIVVHHSEPANNLARWRDEGKHIVVLSTDEKRHPAGPRTLVYPFPAVKVLSMLEHVEAEMESGTTVPRAATVASAPSKPRATTSSADPWSFVEALRTLRTVNNSTLWLTCKGPQGPFLWIRGDVASYYCDAATAGAIRAGTLDLSGLSLQKGTPPPGNLPARPGEELFWFATFHASPSLAPWLHDKTVYRLVRWPDLGRLRANDAAERTAQIRVIAALAAGPSALSRLSANVDGTARTLNALASCALIETAQPTPAAPKVARAESSVPTPVGGLKQFLRNMRKHLRLGGNS